MPKYMICANYVGKGLTGLLGEGGSGRRAAIEETVRSVGGTVEGIYYAFGDVDVYIIVDVPDNESAAAISLVVNASGEITERIIVLMSPEEMDGVVRKAVAYRPPGD